MKFINEQRVWKEQLRFNSDNKIVANGTQYDAIRAGRYIYGPLLNYPRLSDFHSLEGKLTGAAQIAEKKNRQIRETLYRTRDGLHFRVFVVANASALDIKKLSRVGVRDWYRNELRPEDGLEGSDLTNSELRPGSTDDEFGSQYLRLSGYRVRTIGSCAGQSLFALHADPCVDLLAIASVMIRADGDADYIFDGWCTPREFVERHIEVDLGFTTVRAIRDCDLNSPLDFPIPFGGIRSPSSAMH
jgi:hypothetical protein